MKNYVHILYYIKALKKEIMRKNSFFTFCLLILLLFLNKCTNFFTGLAQGNTTEIHAQGKFVAVGGSGAAYYSYDGKKWFKSNVPSGNTYRGITYRKQKFVAVNGSNIFYSFDGISWSTVSGHGGRGICYGQGKFVVVNDGEEAFYSYDGINWTQTQVSVSNKLNSVCYGNGKFVAVGRVDVTDRGIYYSSDGITWSGNVAFSGAGELRSVTYGNGKFIAVGESDTVYCSDDGMNWPSTSGIILGSIYSVTFAKNKFVAVGVHNTTGIIQYSKDGERWETVLHILDNDIFLSVTYGAGKFVAVGQNERIHYSYDGITWSDNVGPGGGNNLNGVTYSNYNPEFIEP